MINNFWTKILAFCRIMLLPKLKKLCFSNILLNLAKHCDGTKLALHKPTQRAISLFMQTWWLCVWVIELEWKLVSPADKSEINNIFAPIGHWICSIKPTYSPFRQCKSPKWLEAMVQMSRPRKNHGLLLSTVPLWHLCNWSTGIGSDLLAFFVFHH